MADLLTLRQRLDALRAARAMAVREVQASGGARVTYRSDSELAAAISDLERQIVEIQRPVRRVVVTGCKGV